MISKLSKAYKTADPEQWLTGKIDGLDPIFAGRLAYLASVNRVKFAITEGFRTAERQTELYNRFLKGEIISAAKPGASWHEFRLAVDTSSQPIRRMTNAELKPYGLCKPINAEGWHIQPIETLGQTDREKFAPEQEEEDMLTKYERLRDIPNEYGFRDVIETLMNAKIINGDGSDPGNGDVINLYDFQVRSLIFEYRAGAFDKKLIQEGMDPAIK